MGNVTRDKSIRIAVTEGELAIVHELAHRARRSLSDYLRELIEREAKAAKLTTTTTKGSKR